MCRFAAIGCVAMLYPQIIAVPAVGARKPVIIFIVVDLPAPLGPRKPSTSPTGTVNEMSSTALSGPKCLTRCRISSIAGWSPIVFSQPMLPSVEIAERLYQHDGSFVLFRRLCAPPLRPSGARIGEVGGR